MNCYRTESGHESINFTDTENLQDFSVLSSYFLKVFTLSAPFSSYTHFDLSTRLGFWLLLSFLHKLKASNHQIPSTQL